MERECPAVKTATIAYFSGTGCTELAAGWFHKQLEEQGLCVQEIRIASGGKGGAVNTDLLLVLSPVYAFRLAEAAEKWVAALPEASRTRAVVISVSGGGEISPNTACRSRCIRLLERKGYAVVYEAMLVMPSNYASPTPPDLAARLIEILPRKVEGMVFEILSGKTKRTCPERKDRFFSWIGKAEPLGARFFGAFLRASKDCVKCGQCVQSCPAGNIRLRDGSPRFGFRCNWCLHCVYTCPQKAISPRILKSVVLKEGFDLQKMRGAPQTAGGGPPVRNAAWSGVFAYLNEGLPGEPGEL